MSHDIQLVRVHPQTISVKEELLRPTQWDHKAVVDDLKDYVAVTRLIKATPSITIVNYELVLLSGLPFVVAALDATPPLPEIICSVQIKKELLEQLGIESVSLKELMNSINESYWAVEMLVFNERLEPNKRQFVEDKVYNFYIEVSTTTENIGNYCSFGEFEWNENNTKVMWKWKRNDKEGNHIVRFYNLLKEIDQTVASIRSWNGIAIIK